MSGTLTKGTPVISLDSGATLGRIESVYLDCEERRLVAFTFGRGSSLFGRKGGHIVEIDDIHAIGPDAVTLDDARAVHDLVLMDGATRHLVELDQLVRREVITDGGSRLGHIVALDFDPKTYRLLQMRIEDRTRAEETVIRAEKIRGIGEKIIVTSDEPRVAVDRLAGTTKAPTLIGRDTTVGELRRVG